MPIREHEFDCAECGTHIVALCDPDPRRKLCAHCITIPGWFRDPQLLELIAPEGLPHLPEHEK